MEDIKRNCGEAKEYKKIILNFFSLTAIIENKAMPFETRTVLNIMQQKWTDTCVSYVLNFLYSDTLTPTVSSWKKLPLLGLGNS